MHTSRMTIKGQITIPKDLRDAFGWGPGDELVFVREADGVKLMAMKPGRKPGDALVARLRGTGNRQRTGDEILALTRGETLTRGEALTRGEDDDA